MKGLDNMTSKEKNGYSVTLSYDATIEKYLATAQGGIYTVQDCPTDAFTAVIQAATVTAEDKDKASLLTALKGLDLHQRVDKWYALNTLGEYGVGIPLFATEDKAKDAQAPKDKE